MEIHYICIRFEIMMMVYFTSIEIGNTFFAPTVVAMSQLYYSSK